MCFASHQGTRRRPVILVHGLLLFLALWGMAVKASRSAPGPILTGALSSAS